MAAYEFPGEAKALHSYWQELRGTAPLPPASAISPFGLRRWMGDLVLLNLEEGPRRLRVRLYGEKVARQTGSKPEMPYLEDHVPEPLREMMTVPYRICEELRTPIFVRVPMALLPAAKADFERMLLPFHGDDESSVARFVVWVAPHRGPSARGKNIYSVVDPQRSTPKTSPDLYRIDDGVLVPLDCAFGTPEAPSPAHGLLRRLLRSHGDVRSVSPGSGW